jgi:hypothetical protein
MKFRVLDFYVEVHAEDCLDVAGTGTLVEAETAFDAALSVCDGNEHYALTQVRYYSCLREPPKRPRRRTRRNIPFLLDDTDDNIIYACAGKRIVWLNELKDCEEIAFLYPSGPHYKFLPRGVIVTTFPHDHTKITVSPSGDRILNFIDMKGTGFRAVRLESIVSVL